mgnify:CR=1 FL=1
MSDTGSKGDTSAKLDRETGELLQGLRVIFPGVAVLFAFLLTLPFTQRFAGLDRAQRGVFYVAFLTAAASLTALVAPGSLHRVRWRQHDKEYLLRVGNRFALAGTAFLAVTVACAVFIVTDVLYKGVAALTAAATAAVGLIVCWFGLGLLRYRGDTSSGG